MQDQLIALLTSKVGLGEDKARQVVEIILKYAQDNPEQMKSYLQTTGMSAFAEKIASILG